MPFASFGLHPALVRAAQALDYHQPTPIQRAALPIILAGQDLIGSAPTGTGKTAAYALGLLHRLQTQPAPATRRVRALVLVPTRELAAQVGDSLRRLGQHLPRPPKIAVVFGGVSINPQMMGLRGGADVVVATPGRLLDLVAHNALRLASVETLVLDEADRLLDLGFADERARVLALLPPRRQSLLFSATFPPEVEALVASLLREPARVLLTPEAGPAGADASGSAATGVAGIVQRAIAVDATRRTQLLRHLVREQGWSRALVFVATRHAAEQVAEKLYKTGIFASPFHGELSQGARTQVLDEFKAGRWDVVITTDLAARGIDIAQLPVVLNYDLPRSAVDYVHRIGRTGRAGAAGLAISFVSAATEAHFRLIEKRQGLSLPREQVAGFEPTETAPPPGVGTGGIKGKRPSKKDKLRAAAR